jgi:predicted RND superfamily exporter protein
MLLNEADSKSLVYVTQPYMNLIYAGGLRDQIDDILLEEPEEPGTKASKLTGGLPVSLDINKGIHDTQAYTTIVTLFVLTLVLMVVFRSPRLGLYTMIPVAVVILWQPLLMRSGDVNVNIFTAMIGTIVFGIGVDDAIHVMHRIREEGESAVGITKAVEHTGQTIFETSLTTVAGMAAGFFVSFPGLENFFVVMMLLICFAFLTSAFLLPAILTAHNKATSALFSKAKWGDLEGAPSLDSGEVVEVELLAKS